MHPSKTSMCPCSLLVYIAVPSPLTLHLYIHHLHRNCVHAVSTSNALPCCFWWRLVPSRSPSTMYKFLLACLSLCLDIRLCISVYCRNLVSCLLLILQSHPFQISSHPDTFSQSLIACDSCCGWSQKTTVRYSRRVHTVKMVILECFGAIGRL